MIEEKLNVTKTINMKILERKYANVINFKEPKFLMIIAGCSGSGKSVFEHSLIEKHGNYFNKLPQITTRKKRNENDNGYYFIDNEVYEYMKNYLFAKLDNFNSNKYGTIPVFQNHKINTVIASYDAIDDIFNFIHNTKMTIVPMLVFFDIKDENISEAGKRADRDDDFLQKERKELLNRYEKYRDQCIYSAYYNYEDYGRFINLDDILEF